MADEKNLTAADFESIKNRIKELFLKSWDSEDLKDIVGSEDNADILYCMNICSSGDLYKKYSKYAVTTFKLSEEGLAKRCERVFATAIKNREDGTLGESDKKLFDDYYSSLFFAIEKTLGEKSERIKTFCDKYRELFKPPPNTGENNQKSNTQPPNTGRMTIKPDKYGQNRKPEDKNLKPVEENSGQNSNIDKSNQKYDKIINSPDIPDNERANVNDLINAKVAESVEQYFSEIAGILTKLKEQIKDLQKREKEREIIMSIGHVAEAVFSQIKNDGILKKYQNKTINLPVEFCKIDDDAKFLRDLYKKNPDFKEENNSGLKNDEKPDYKEKQIIKIIEMFQDNPKYENLGEKLEVIVKFPGLCAPENSLPMDFTQYGAAVEFVLDSDIDPSLYIIANDDFINNLNDNEREKFFKVMGFEFDPDFKYAVEEDGCGLVHKDTFKPLVLTGKKGKIVEIRPAIEKLSLESVRKYFEDKFKDDEEIKKSVTEAVDVYIKYGKIINEHRLNEVEQDKLFEWAEKIKIYIRDVVNRNYGNVFDRNIIKSIPDDIKEKNNQFVGQKNDFVYYWRKIRDELEARGIKKHQIKVRDEINAIKYNTDGWVISVYNGDEDGAEDTIADIEHYGVEVNGRTLVPPVIKKFGNKN